ncbi:MAG: response regulator [Candidatus Saelkia tenebricola]|nr:response regulator [Candidatus Saelkia tenebricola]
MKMNEILIIEDDKEMCEELTNILESEDYFVESVNDGDQGISLAEKGDYDIVLLDLKIPGVNGYDVLKTIKEKCLKTKVLILTGSPMVYNILLKKVDKKKMLNLADTVIYKPFNVMFVLDEIKRLLHKN